ncbi:MAG TPA: DivIVA domain-containing protein [Myxococcales bacterium]|nr:DivIVA domain-containing protein [Myxococcales bacterium]
MKVTPLDIRQKQFRTKFRGLDGKEVEAFLELIAAEFEEVIRENIALKDDLKRKVARLEEFHEREKTLQETMVTAQKITEDIKDSAKRQAEVIVGEAELQAEKIVQGAHTRLVQVLDEISELKRQRTQFEAQIRSAVESQLKLLEVFQAQPAPSPRIGENVEFLQKQPKKAGAAE